MLNRFSFHSWLRSIGKLHVSFLFILGSVSMSTTFAQQTHSEHFKPNLINLEGAVSDPFRFQATLKNVSDQVETFDLKADLPAGWRANFTAMGSRVTSLQIEPGAEQQITMEVFPSPSTKPGNYEIPLHASSPNTSNKIDFQASITGSHNVELTTPEGKVSNDLVSGSSKTFNLRVENTGSLPLSDLEIDSRLPSKWEAELEPVKIDQLEPGKSADVQVKLQAPEKTIAGDYMAKFTLKNANTQDELDYRLTVKTSILSGWIGFLVILLAIGLIYGLIRKYGRR